MAVDNFPITILVSTIALVNGVFGVGHWPFFRAEIRQSGRVLLLAGPEVLTCLHIDTNEPNGRVTHGLYHIQKQSRTGGTFLGEREYLGGILAVSCCAGNELSI